MEEAKRKHPRAYEAIRKAHEVFRCSSNVFGSLLMLSPFAIMGLQLAHSIAGTPITEIVVSAHLGLYLWALGSSFATGVLAVVAILTINAVCFFRYSLGQLLGSVLFVGFCVALLVIGDNESRLFVAPVLMVGCLVIVLHIYDSDPTQRRDASVRSNTVRKAQMCPSVEA